MVFTLLYGRVHNMKTLRLVLVLLILITTVIVVRHNFANDNHNGKNSDLDKDEGRCHAMKKAYEPLSFIDQKYKEKGDFKFIIDSQKVAETKALISNHQLVDLQRQLVAADMLYQQVLGLTAPLDKPRYQRANYIKVIMALIDGNGLSYDEVTADKALDTLDCNISMKLKATLKATNGTPAHELFHMYQNSYFMFKNRWLTEGTAQWSESLLNKGLGKRISASLPQNLEELEATMQLSYNASAMWTRLFQLVDKKKEFNIPRSIKATAYTNGDSIIKDNKAYGTSFIKVLFEELEAQSKQASSDNGWDTYNWKERDQKSAASNNVYIWRAVQNAVNKTVPVEQQSEELKHFINISL